MLKLTIAALAAMLLTACGSPEKRTEKQQEKTILCGGYTRQRPLEASDRELFRRATAGMTGVSYTIILSLANWLFKEQLLFSIRLTP